MSDAYDIRLRRHHRQYGIASAHAYVSIDVSKVAARFLRHIDEQNRLPRSSAYGLDCKHSSWVLQQREMFYIPMSLNEYTRFLQTTPTTRRESDARLTSKTGSGSRGAGFLGSHLCERLLNQGHEVICVDDFVTGAKANVAHLMCHPGFELIRHDITEPLFLQVDEIYNLACPASPVHYQGQRDLP